MIDVFTHDALTAAIGRSRALVGTAVDALCDVITDVTGAAPDRSHVEYVSMHWLMQACDKYVYAADESPERRMLDVDVFSTGAPTRRARALATISSKKAPTLVTEPYLKVGIRGEFSAVARSRSWLRWAANPATGLATVTADVSARQCVARASIGARGSKEDLRNVIALTAPVELIELHHTLASWAESATIPGLRLAFTANAHQSSIAYRYWATAQRRLGTRLAVQQHGGSYGIDEHHLGEHVDISSGDVFYTWGWDRSDLGTRVRPLPTAMPKRASRGSATSYLLMSIPVSTHFYRLQSFLVPSQIECAINETVAFAAALSDAAPLVVRSLQGYEFPVARLGSPSVRVSIDDMRDSGPVAASRHALTIHNYLGTSWLETLAMNVPTVCFYDPQTYRARAAARPFIDSLVRVGVIHHSGGDAAAFVNGLRGDPHTWWNSDEVQHARQTFVARYANFSDDWLTAWREEFERLLAE